MKKCIIEIRRGVRHYQYLLTNQEEQRAQEDAFIAWQGDHIINGY
jgi:hypothetical protein